MTREELLYNILRRMVARVDLNGGLGEYKGGPSWVLADARKALEEHKSLYRPMSKSEGYVE